MRNKFPGTCFRCGELVEVGAGHFERTGDHWRVQHAGCAIKFRGQPEKIRDDLRMQRLEQIAKGTGSAAQRARRELRDQAARKEPS